VIAERAFTHRSHCRQCSLLLRVLADPSTTKPLHDGESSRCLLPHRMPIIWAQHAPEKLMWQIEHLRGRVMATLSRRGSATKPRRLSWLQRTVLKIITSASRP
jgi:hypothetical protein